jgi:hypothetical protein
MKTIPLCEYATTKTYLTSTETYWSVLYACKNSRTKKSKVFMLVTIINTYCLLDSNTREYAGGSFLKNVSEFLQDYSYMQSHPNTCSTQKPTNGYLWNLILQNFTNITTALQYSLRKCYSNNHCTQIPK